MLIVEDLRPLTKTTAFHADHAMSSAETKLETVQCCTIFLIYGLTPKIVDATLL